jgi:hypothetical protein
MLEAPPRVVCSIVHTAYHDRASLPDQPALREGGSASAPRGDQQALRKADQPALRETDPPALREAPVGRGLEFQTHMFDGQPVREKRGRDRGEQAPRNAIRTGRGEHTASIP